MKERPSQCRGCVLDTKGTGYAESIGPHDDALIAFIGEALGKTEARMGLPFVGQAGVYLNRAFARLGIERGQVVIGNVVSCQPPNDWLDRAPWEHAAISHCHVHRTRFYASNAKVFVTLGAVATRTLVKEMFNIDYSGKLENWHGYVITDEKKQRFIIPTFHPAFIIRGKQGHFGPMLHDIKKAMEVAAFGWQEEAFEDVVVVDPPVEWFREFVESIPEDPDFWLAVDIECPSKGDDEDDVSELLGTITRINFATNSQQGITVPWEERYRPLIQRALNTKATKLFWNAPFDVPMLAKQGMDVKGRIYDGMWAWHLLQTDVPKGLGFVAPFYSKLPPWKHLNGTDPGLYAAVDAVQTVRCLEGIVADLKKQGLYEAFLRYVVQYDRQALWPMSASGLQVDRKVLESLSHDLLQEKEKIRLKIMAMVPEEARPLAGGWKRKPADDKYPGAFLKKVKERVLYCNSCDTAEVGPKHKCSPKEANDNATG